MVVTQGINKDEVNQENSGGDGAEGNDPGTGKDVEIELGDKFGAECE